MFDTWVGGPAHFPDDHGRQKCQQLALITYFSNNCFLVGTGLQNSRICGRKNKILIHFFFNSKN